MRISIMLTRALASAVEGAGVDRELFLAAAGIDPALLKDLQARISLDEHRRAVRAAYKLTADPALGLHVGERMGMSSFDVLGHLTEQSSCLRAALLTAVRYSRFVSEGPRVELEEHKDTATLRLLLPEENTPESRLASEFSCVALLRVVRAFVGKDALPLQVFFTHPKPRHHAEYTRCFGGTERFSQAITGIQLPIAFLDQRSRDPNSELHGYLLQRAELLLAKANRDASTTDRVASWIAAQTELTRPSLDEVARALGTSTRSLRRRLQAERTQFSSLVDDARAVHAKRMLQDPQRGIQDAAYALGFRTPSAFTRAFKRWTGMGPQAYRKVQRATDSRD
ncbi:MAG TPA: AraC family transcriptional regulator [Polyangiales bacterium]|nr:AraC family transcriptional regulator [Polyangiales bacterium]